MSNRVNPSLGESVHHIQTVPQMLLSSLTKFVPLSAPRLSRLLQNRALARPVPPSTELIKTPTDFLKAIGRSSDEKLNVENWEELWRMNGLQLKQKGLAVKERKYLLWSLEQFRLGRDPAVFAYAEKAKKQIRGWGPAVQNGKRIRSKRH